MKLKVIGWTDCSDNTFPVRKWSKNVDRAIVENLKTNGYCFGGDLHEYYCPVFNDGTRKIYSARGFGGIMAKAHGVRGKYAYVQFYMHNAINPERVKFPPLTVNVNELKQRSEIADTYEMHLTEEPFEAVKNGTKTIEVRLYDEKRKRIDEGDFILFTKQGTGERICVSVTDMYFASVPNILYQQIKIEQFGCGALTNTEFAAKLNEYYSNEAIKQYGLIAFKIQRN